MKQSRGMLLVAGLLLFGMGGCELPFGADGADVVHDDNVVAGTGTVRYSELEGGLFVIVADNDQTYEPINLADSLKRDGVRVRFRIKIRNDLGSVYMVGRVVEILEIRKL